MIVGCLDMRLLSSCSLELGKLCTLKSSIATNLLTHLGPFSSRLGHVSIRELGLERVDNRQRLKRRGGESSKIMQPLEIERRENTGTEDPVELPRLEPPGAPDEFNEREEPDPPGRTVRK